MNEDAYMYFIRACIVGFFLIRAPYKMQMQLSFNFKTKLFPSTNYAIKEIVAVALFSIGFILVPVLWGPERFEMGTISFPNSMRLAGLIFCIFGLMLFWLSHHYLGKNFNQVVALREGHKLVQNGIYRHIRHPMYSSFYLLCLGFFLASSNWIVGLATFSGVHFLYLLRVEKEEVLLTMEFGEEYREYIKSSGRLVPKFNSMK
jgi:protein-S-isoprenylcysteine O-methyltransferase Ste14